jgi:hypothetical protein
MTTSRSWPRRRGRFLAVVASVVALLGNHTCSAFVPTTRIIPAHRAQTKLFASKKKGRFAVFGNIRKGAKGAVKAVLPNRWTKSKEERQLQIQKLEQREELKSNLSLILRDAPPPLAYAVGNVLVPVISGIADIVKKQSQSPNGQRMLEEVKRKYEERLVEEMRKSQLMENLLGDAKASLMADPIAREALGEPFDKVGKVTTVFNTAIINGETNTFIPIFNFFVVGSKDQGFVSLTATNTGIKTISVNMASGTDPIEVAPISTGIIGNGERFRAGSDDDSMDVELIGPN